MKTENKMVEKLRGARYILVIVILMWLILNSITYRIDHPEMTETQLFIHFFEN